MVARFSLPLVERGRGGGIPTASIQEFPHKEGGTSVDLALPLECSEDVTEFDAGWLENKLVCLKYPMTAYAIQGAISASKSKFVDLIFSWR